MPKGKQISDDTIERFVEVVREKLFIYDPKDESHMDSQKINNVWECSAEMMNVSGLHGELNDGIPIIITSRYTHSWFYYNRMRNDPRRVFILGTPILSVFRYPRATSRVPLSAILAPSKRSFNQNVENISLSL